jgi:beta-lactamase class A
MDLRYPPSKKTALVVATCLVLVGCWIGSAFKSHTYDEYFDAVQNTRLTSDSYKLIAPLIGTESPSALEIGRLESIHSSLQAYADQHKDEVDSYSLYYRDLYSSQWFGINEDESYIPASLLKIALAISFLKQEEESPVLAKTEKVYTQQIADINKSVKYLEPTALVVGQSYSTDELLKKMMVDSDNGAKDLIFSLLDKGYFYDLFRLIGAKEPSDPSKYTISAKEYAFFLRLLYNSTYLSEENSEKLLDIMAQSTFKDGLVAGVPADITVAHKYGTYTFADAQGNRTGVELHDCGIIYRDLHPYLLCMMTKGTNADKLASFVAGMSKTAYQAVEDYYAN